MFENVQMPIKVQDLISTSMELVSLVAPFILPILALVFCRILINFLHEFNYFNSESKRFNQSKNLRKGDQYYVTKKEIFLDSLSSTFIKYKK